MQRKRSHKKFRVKTNWPTAVTLFRDYADHSTIHGVHYLSETGRSWCERIWWITAICASVICCGKLILDVWSTDSIIITFTEKPTPIWKIPFPAVSICPSMLTHYKHINLTPTMYEHCMGLATQKQIAQLHAVSIVCHFDVLFGSPENYPTDCNECLATLREVRIPPDDFFVECKYQNRKISCLESVEETVVDVALCYTFNGVAILRASGSIDDDRELAEEWSIDEGYKSPDTVDMYPRRASGTGPQFGFSTLLRLSKHDFDYRCSMNPGFYLEYRMPYDYPDVTMKFFEIRMGSAVNVILKPKMITTAEELHGYPVAERKCYLDNERRLKYFKQYTPTNCEVECKADYVFKMCGCLPIHLESKNIDKIKGQNNREKKSN